jgi:hypothetical protein
MRENQGCGHHLGFKTIALGAVHYLAGHAAEIYEAVGDGLWSAVIASTHDGDTITHSEVACPPRRH